MQQKKIGDLARPGSAGMYLYYARQCYTSNRCLSHMEEGCSGRGEPGGLQQQKSGCVSVRCQCGVRVHCTMGLVEM